MIANEQITFTVVQLGDFNMDEARNVFRLASNLQAPFRYSVSPVVFPVEPSQYELPNGGFDLDRAATDAVRTFTPRPAILVSSLPYTTADQRSLKKDDNLFFLEEELDGEPDVSIISTYLWKTLDGKRRLQPYILLMLAIIALHKVAKLQFHLESQSCPFDYCEPPVEIDSALKAGQLCRECESMVYRSVRNGSTSIYRIAAAKKLLHRACDKRMCFIAMPFRRHMQHVYEALDRALSEAGWTVLRADTMSRRGRITDISIEGILISDLVIADLTGSNPNVFYELGLAHAAGCDTVLLTQDRKVPIDVALERAIFYTNSPRGVSRAISELMRLLGTRPLTFSIPDMPNG